MGDFNLDDRLQGLAFAENLARLAREAPSREVKSRVMAVVNSVRRAYGMSDQQKADLIFELITEGAATVEDLKAETGFRRQAINELITYLKNTRRVRISYINDGRQGPPRQLIVPILTN